MEVGGTQTSLNYSSLPLRPKPSRVQGTSVSSVFTYVCIFQWEVGRYLQIIVFFFNESQIKITISHSLGRKASIEKIIGSDKSVNIIIICIMEW